MASTAAARFDAWYTEARRAWPSVEIGVDEFAAYVSQRVPPDEDGQSLHPADLYLACACAHGDPDAMALFASQYLSEVGAVAAALRAPAELGEEARQVLWIALLVRQGDRPPSIATYRGIGDLRGWVRVAAVREVLRLSSAGKRLVLDHAIAEALSPAFSPELAYLGNLYQAEVEDAFRSALRALPARDRSLLRYQVLEGLTLPEIAELHGVSRSTIARALAAARSMVLERTRAILAERLGARLADVDSVIRLVRSRLDVCAESALSSTGPAQR